MSIVIHTDGGARGNPGPAAIGVVIDRLGKQITFGKKIGETTNNVAEYKAVIAALVYLKDHNIKGESVSFFLDSTLVVNQLNGLFKVKQAHLQNFLLEIRALEHEIGERITYTYVPREQNKEADFWVNDALDQ